MHSNCDYSSAYVNLICSNTPHVGLGIAFCLGTGNEVIIAGIKALERVVVGKSF
jgi:hypothetical protein